MKAPCILTIFLCAKVAVNRETNMITGIFPKHPDDVKFMECTVGENQSLPNKFCPVELFKYGLNEIFETVNQQVPVIIVFKRKDPVTTPNQLGSNTLYFQINRRDNMNGKNISKGRDLYFTLLTG